MAPADILSPVDLSTPAGRYGAALMLLALVAYPESPGKRDKAMLAMQAMMVRKARAIRRIERGDPAWSILALVATRDTAGPIRLLEQRVQDRLDAADVFALLLLGIRRRPGGPPHSLNSLSAARFTSPAKFKHDVWRRYEVMHLAFALRHVMQHWKGPPEFSIAGLLMTHDRWITDAIDRAERMAAMRQRGAIRPALRGFPSAKLHRLIPANVHIGEPPT